MYMYVCMHVYCTYVYNLRLYVGTYACMHVCMHILFYLYMKI